MFVFFIRLRMAQEIQRQLEECEVKTRELEERGVTVEKSLRGEPVSIMNFKRKLRFIYVEFSVNVYYPVIYILFYYHKMLYKIMILECTQWVMEFFTGRCL